MTRLRISHATTYDYVRRVSLSYNEARMSPLTDPHQVVLESSLTVGPEQAAVETYRDYWGTRVTSFDITSPHDRLAVLAEATVEVHRGRGPGDVDAEPVGWDELRAPATQNRFSDWLPLTPLSGPGDEVIALVRDEVRGLDPHEASMAVFAWMRGQMSYVPGATHVHSNAEHAWTARKGVCQDLAHLGAGALRSLGIPARYVSGYLHPRPAVGIGEEVVGESHAWVEWWDGAWRAWDPTNTGPVGDLHVVVARGRDYRDVTPLKGILSGGGGSTLSVRVAVTRLA
ncbi:transglutaminase family protein [Tersicoccus sp. Bi-70]|uniref:transglutaminase family protein n=1 Tax=Tersicoccus sp. Bi-70 TaxID=1897634 RepID=UPI0009789716|nr:transglutaminase family protein [Tersicoccus sp. Bi-70]OMH33034.1 transglutaminase [Tersicoccus sp. Bi-70]